MPCEASIPERDMAAQAYDERLRDALLAALAADPITAACELRVGVHHGIAHLGGAAPSFAAWTAAEQIAGRVRGVRGVVNRIAAPSAPSPARTIHCWRWACCLPCSSRGFDARWRPQRARNQPDPTANIGAVT